MYVVLYKGTQNIDHGEMGTFQASLQFMGLRSKNKTTLIFISLALNSRVLFEVVMF